MGRLGVADHAGPVQRITADFWRKPIPTPSAAALGAGVLIY